MYFEILVLVGLLLVGASQGKVYDRCELARELKFVHNAASHQLATWVCIAEHESQYNTSIVGHLNGDGSGDHGIFQISDQYWCSPPGKGYACGVTCAELEDDDITDDFECAQRIYKEHKQLSGDGFNAWAVYKPHCKGLKAQSYIKNCFDDSEAPKTVTTPSLAFAHGFFDTVAGRANKESLTSAQKTSFHPFLSFRSPSIVHTEEITFTTEKPLSSSFVTPKSTFLGNGFYPSTENPKFDLFFTPRTTTTFRPIVTQTSTFVPTTRSSIIFNPTTSVFPTVVSTSPIFGFGKSSFPTTKLFRQTAPVFQTSTVSYPAPVFIINGVKWY